MIYRCTVHSADRESSKTLPITAPDPRTAAERAVEQIMLPTWVGTVSVDVEDALAVVWVYEVTAERVILAKLSTSREA